MQIGGQNLCIACMKPISADGKCPFCGLKQADYSLIPRCLKPGTELSGRYILGGVLGEGNFGITYIAWDKILEITVAVKEYFPSELVGRDVIFSKDNQVHVYEKKETADYRKKLDKFLNEAKCLANFNQVSGIVSVQDFFYENNTAYIIMQYIDGISVKEYIEKEGKMLASEVLEKMKPLLSALGKVHETGMIHRDISPDNILMRQDGTLVLIDFGAARLRNVEKEKTVTVMFKRGFSPEEQYRFKGKWGAYTDVYSLCATMYYMMTGEAPADSVMRGLRDDIRSLVGMKELDISQGKRKAIMKGMSVLPRNRWQNIPELEAALSQDEGEVTKGRRKKVICMGVSICFLILGVGSLYVRLGKPQQEQSVQTAVTTQNTEASQEGETETPVGTILMADFTGRTKKKVLGDLKEYKDFVSITWKEKYSAKEKKGMVIGQSIKKTTELTAGKKTPLVLTVSRGERLYRMANFLGMTKENAADKCKKKSFRCKFVYSNSKKNEGTVIGQSPVSGKKVKRGTEITLTISRGMSTPVRASSNRNEKTKKKNSSGADGFAGVIR